MKGRSIRKKLLFQLIWIGIITFIVSLLLSFVIFVPHLRREAVAAAEKSNEEIIRQLEDVTSYVEDFTESLAVSVEQNSAVQQYWIDPNPSNEGLASLALNGLTSYEGVIRAILLESDGAGPLDSISKTTETDLALLNSSWYKRIHEAQFGRSFSSVYQVVINHQTYYTVAYVRNFFQHNRWCTFTVLVTLNDDLFDAASIGDRNLDYFMLLDADDQPFYSSGDSAWADSLAGIQPTGKSGTVELQGKGIAFTRKSVRNNWSIVSFVSNSSIINTLVPYMIELLIILLIFLLLTMFAASTTINSIARPVISLSKQMDRAAKGDLSCRVAFNRDDEIGMLGTSYNKMLDDMKQYIRANAQKEKQKQQILFSLLVSQIDPHFIFNTITSINYLARKNRCDDVIAVNTALMAILRDRLRVSDIQNTDTVAKEMAVVDQYIIIQKYMYEGDLVFRWDVDDSLLEEQIPKNMIEPLVENCLLHGLINEDTGEINGEIVVRVYRDGEDIAVAVSDNGHGMDEEQLQRLSALTPVGEERGRRIGLANVRGRLYYLYGKSDCLQIESAPGKGTVVTLRFLSKNNG
ncbi:MAG: histidine kinase [Eubacteriales bacterium]|nr:histidine kinase [Eubacteriales bacterium]